MLTRMVEPSHLLPTADMATGNMNNPVGLDGTTPMGPNDDTLIVNSDTAASPTLKETATSAVDTGRRVLEVMIVLDQKPA